MSETSATPPVGSPASPFSGLSDDEARRRRAREADPYAARSRHLETARRLAGLLLDPMAMMLLCAATVYLALGERTDGVILLVALVPVLAVDVVLEARSRSALRRLAERMAPSATVIRDGAARTVATEEIVRGDVLVLREGDIAQADGSVLAGANLATDEASLTGESEPRSKAPGEPFYAGSTVVSGHGWGEVTETGPRTRYGEIARLVGSVDDRQSPLQRRTGRLVRQLAGVVGAVAVAVFALGLLRDQSPTQALLGAISLGMAALPEEFPLVLTLFLSVGAWRLTRHGLLVRRLASVETLGATTVICTDKTGTLTRGEFVVDEVVALGADPRAVLEAAVLACEQVALDPMERAIDAAAGPAAGAVRARYALVRDHDFDPVGKHMSHVWRGTDGSTRLVAKGALEGILEHCRHDGVSRDRAQGENARLASHGMRVLAVAARDAPPGPDRAADEVDLELVGLLGFRDPLRPEVREAIRECRAAGVRIKLVTGDHPLTAHAIADDAGIAHGPDGIATGPELAALDEPARRHRLRGADVLARIDPAQKLWIVESLQRDGQIVAMTGDGINDAPALRRADIGVSMGQRATAVARAAADMVLLDDDFTGIVAAIREGRRILRDLQRAFLYLVAFHVPIVGLAILAPLVGTPLVLFPVHLVWLELVVHPVSALLFQGGPTGSLMERPPRRVDAPLLPRRGVLRAVASGVALTAAAFTLFLAALPRGEEVARALAIACQMLGYQLVMLSRDDTDLDADPVQFGRGGRFWVVWGLAGASLPLALYVPALATLLHLAPLGPADWALAAGAAALATGWRLTR